MLLAARAEVAGTIAAVAPRAATLNAAVADAGRRWPEDLARLAPRVSVAWAGICRMIATAVLMALQGGRGTEARAFLSGWLGLKGRVRQSLEHRFRLNAADVAGCFLKAMWVVLRQPAWRRADHPLVYLREAVQREAQRIVITPGTTPSIEAFVEAQPTVWDEKGEFRLTVRQLIPTDATGAWHLKLEQARAALERDGLLDPARKRPLPPFPTRLGVVTSAEGAAVKDIVSVLRRRWPAVEVLLVPAQVQGKWRAKLDGLIASTRARRSTVHASPGDRRMRVSARSASRRSASLAPPGSSGRQRLHGR